jgi:hypothetical protein
LITNEIAVALGNATENDKAEFAQFLLDALAPHGVVPDASVKRVLVGAMDRYAAPEGGTDEVGDTL